jgi:hypothetical protein
LRWWIAFGGPFLFAAACLGAAFATLGTSTWLTPLLFSGVIVLPVLWGYAITHWALANDANAHAPLEPAAEEGSA